MSLFSIPNASGHVVFDDYIFFSYTTHILQMLISNQSYPLQVASSTIMGQLMHQESLGR